MEALARLDPLTKAASQRFVTDIAEHFDLAGALLFGSRARGAYRADSDADVAVLLRGPKQPLVKTMWAMSDLAFDVLLETGIDISPLPIWLDEWETPAKHANPDLVRAIKAEGIGLL